MSDRRGQSTVLGFIFVIAIVVALIGLNQAVLVPNANEEVEFKHSQKIQDDMVNLRNNVQQAASSDDDQTTSLNLGPRYPQRFLAVNPGEPAGTLRTIGTNDPASQISVKNVEASDSDANDYWNGSFTATYPTGRIVYNPAYNLYQGGQRHVIENSLLYSVSPTGSEIVRTEQSLVRGKRINLIALDGSKSTSTTRTVSTELEPLSASSNRIAVRNSSLSDPINITLKTNLSEGEWVNTVLDDELDQDGKAPSPADCVNYNKSTYNPTDGRYVVNCVYDSTDSEITLTMQPNVTYSLKTSKLGIGSSASETTERYISVIGPNRLDVGENTSTTFTVEVRDGYNNPVGGVQVSVATKLNDSNSTISPVENDKITDDDGRVTFLYESAGEVDSVTSLQDQINISYTLSSPNLDTPKFNSSKPENATVRTVISNTDRSGLANGSLINPAGSGAVFISDVSYDTGNKTAVVTFTNNGTSSAEWQKARLAYIDGNQNGGPGDGVNINGSSNDKLVNLDSFESVDTSVKFAPGSSGNVDFESLSGTNIKKQTLVIQVKYKSKPGVTTYFIFVPS